MSATLIVILSIISIISVVISLVFWVTESIFGVPPAWVLWIWGILLVILFTINMGLIAIKLFECRDKEEPAKILTGGSSTLGSSPPPRGSKAGVTIGRSYVPESKIKDVEDKLNDKVDKLEKSLLKYFDDLSAELKSSLERQKTSIDESKMVIENLSSRVSGLQSMIPGVLLEAYGGCYMGSPRMYGCRGSGGGGDTFDRSCPIDEIDRTDGRTRGGETAAVARTARAGVSGRLFSGSDGDSAPEVAAAAGLEPDSSSDEESGSGNDAPSGDGAATARGRSKRTVAVAVRSAPRAGTLRSPPRRSTTTNTSKARTK